MIKVLFVCLGNICRSPLAEGIFNHKIRKYGLENKFESDSCGTSDYHIGELPDDRTLKCASKYQIPINHRARQINRVDLRESHYLIAMDFSNKRNIESLLEKHRIKHDQLFLIREFQPGAEELEVPDPYYGGEDGFEKVYQILDNSIEHFLEHLKQSQNIYV
ncbi:low molecular weight protein-tyrosine-phosphatase [Cecembia calidifontis]|jgi:protein-tyrosine phosphatase|uniref:protein-tyrosine-phosphatase n=1 Tax=Cecembia calidifontis TaxID=1187080 RepID=A0A4Q7P826_9BACT|nr:low molecular weight protein-tyrosine-phosphatase [Cecembia calidifontis]RZS94852.1 protein tyrosine phosphatase [Cecembia calidifontis]